ncbi:VanZ like family protein [Paenibacillus sp. 1_12]|uniref:VanZ family protein n=1 Tax=Paenibacillus sp. 1_12 TaxID=1566278 RepID=UPI0008F1C203|nr:VanZ family protein [Paenibacillus sp. 1_12]SFL48490.1 VanZ like family protein [Paenibacillus sp. 1_12]
MRIVTRLLPAVLWMGAIFYLSARTGDDMGGWLIQFQRFIPFMEGLDWGHFLAYFILSITYAWAFGKHKLNWGHKCIVVLLCTLYGITDEFHQSFVPGRAPDVMDIRNDAIGAALAMLFISIPIIKVPFDRWKGAKYY